MQFAHFLDMSNLRIRNQVHHYVPESVSRTEAASVLVQKSWRGWFMRRVWQLLKQTRGDGDEEPGFEKVAKSGKLVRKHVVKIYRRLAEQASARHEFAESVKHLRTALSVAASLERHKAVRTLQVLLRAHLAFRKMCRPMPFMGLSLDRDAPVKSIENAESKGTQSCCALCYYVPNRVLDSLEPLSRAHTFIPAIHVPHC